LLANFLAPGTLGETVAKPTPEPPIKAASSCSFNRISLSFPGQQLLLEYDMTFSPQASPEEKAIDVGGLALGYNVSLHKRIELITEVFFDIPQQDEAFAVRLLIGFIATLPAAK